MQPSRFARAVLWVDILVFVGFGAAFLVAPVALLAPLGIELRTDAAVIEIRAVYGGLQLGIGACLLGCALRRESTSVGLRLAATTLGGLVLVRLFAMVVAGAFSALLAALAAAELLGAGINATALWQNRRAR